jgi:hypothetical protein
MRALLPLTAGLVLAAGCACCSGVFESLQNALNEAGVEMPADIGSTTTDDGGAEPTKAAGSSGDPCDAYADCVCNLGKAFGSVMPTDSYDQACEGIKNLKSLPNSGDTCKQMLDAMTQSLGPQKDTYKSMGVDLPAACL